MSAHYRLEVDDFYEVLDEWNAHLKSRIFIAACGGTALTLYGHKESTQDVDLLVPDPAHYRVMNHVLLPKSNHEKLPLDRNWLSEFLLTESA